MSRGESLVWLLRRHAFRWLGWGLIAFVILYGGCSMVRTIPGVVTKAASSSTKAAPKPTPAQPAETAEHVHATVVGGTPKEGDDRIIGFVRGGVITPRGVLRKDDHITIDGQVDFVAGVNFYERLLILGSGKKIRK